MLMVGRLVFVRMDEDGCKEKKKKKKRTRIVPQ
jgi:hypothetical protein